jgi:hypothetical protein
MLTQRRNALALAAVLTVTTVTGGALVTVLSSPHSAARPSSINPAVVTLPQVAAPQPAAPFVAATNASHDAEEGDS